MNIMLIFWLEERITSKIFDQNSKFWAQIIKNVNQYMFVNEWWKMIFAQAENGYQLLHSLEEYLCNGTMHVIRGKPQVATNNITTVQYITEYFCACFY